MTVKSIDEESILFDISLGATDGTLGWDGGQVNQKKVPMLFANIFHRLLFHVHQ